MAVSPFLGRATWGVADQAVSSLTNFGIAFLVASSVGQQTFGAFGLVLATYFLALGLVRAVAGDPLLIRFTTVEPADRAGAVSGASGTALVGGAMAGAGLIVASRFMSGSSRDAFFVLGFFLPGLLLQDVWRYGFFSGGRARTAFVNDAIWALSMGVCVAILIVSDRTSLTAFEIAWAGTGNLAALAGWLQSGGAPDVLRPLAWVRQQRDLLGRYILEFTALSAGSHLILVALAAVAGLLTVAAIRGGQLLLGPLNIVFFGIFVMAVPEGVRALARSPGHLKRLCRYISAGLGLSALVWGAIVLALPTSIGESLLGDTWESARSVAAPLAVGMIAWGIADGATIGLRALADAGKSLSSRVIGSAVVFVATMAGGFAGPVEAAWGFALGFWVAAAVWWWQLNRGLAAATASVPALATDAG